MAGIWEDIWEDIWADIWADAPAVSYPYQADLNTRIMLYLRDLYTVTDEDLTTLVDRYLDAETTGDRTDRMQRLVAAATAAMT